MGRQPILRVPFIALVIFVTVFRALPVSWPAEPWFKKRRILETCLLGSNHLLAVFSQLVCFLEPEELARDFSSRYERQLSVYHMNLQIKLLLLLQLSHKTVKQNKTRVLPLGLLLLVLLHCWRFLDSLRLLHKLIQIFLLRFRHLEKMNISKLSLESAFRYLFAVTHS